MQSAHSSEIKVERERPVRTCIKGPTPDLKVLKLDFFFFKILYSVLPVTPVFYFGFISA